MDTLSPFPLVLPQKGLFCHNHLTLEHALVSLLLHVILFIYKQPQCKDSNRYSVIQHYCLVWASVLTSPRGRQLDFWLCILVFMDVTPIVMSLYQTVMYFSSLQASDYDDEYDNVVWRLTRSMRSWSPAYQLNNWLMEAVDGSIWKHVYILIMFTLAITQIHKFIVGHMYCAAL